ncbi:S41 family peptidase [Chryseobacterium wangxinyae]|uniref:S41 family peptidase n=1 Tax=Chryseobacterium sp. CY353 TaxID=2997334 RepID=UPI00226ED511|nr:S41 family peptidase [Chryseobacterium sp. CY353]MCY0971127.1 S41 family peptidase [Chryseobacterium sp. CY353]
MKFLSSLVVITLLSTNVFAQNTFQLKKLEDLAEVYGIVRYFHPSRTAAEIDWNNFLQDAVSKTLKVKNDKEYEDLIKSLLKEVSPSITFGNVEYRWDKSIDTTAVYWQHKGVGTGTINPKGYMYESNLKTYSANKNNEASLPNIKNVTLKQSGNFLINIPTVVYTKHHPFTEIDDDPSVVNTDRYAYNVMAISNLIITWNIFRHFYPYQEDVNINWKRIFRKALQMAFNDKDDEGHLITLQKFTEVFKDGHINILNSKLVKERYAPPVVLTMVNNKLVVKKVLNDSISLKVGNTVKFVNSVPTRKYLDSLKQFKSGSTQLKSWIAIKLLLTGPKNSYLNLTLDDNKRIQLKRTVNYSKNIDLFERESNVEFKFLKDSILYINWDKFSKKTFLTIQPQIESAKKIIIDLRGYPRNGGEIEMRNSYFPNINNVNFLYLPIITQPYYKNVKYEKGPWDIKSDKRLSAKIVLLLDERAVSYPESLAQYLKYNNYVTVIGRPSGGANGNINKVRLLDGFWFMYTGMLDKNPDGSVFNAKGVTPDIYVEPSLTDIKEGKDSILDAAIQYLQ